MQDLSKFPPRCKTYWCGGFWMPQTVTQVACSPLFGSPTVLILCIICFYWLMFYDCLSQVKLNWLLQGLDEGQFSQRRTPCRGRCSELCLLCVCFAAQQLRGGLKARHRARAPAVHGVHGQSALRGGQALLEVEWLEPAPDHHNKGRKYVQPFQKQSLRDVPYLPPLFAVSCYSSTV